MPHASTYIPSNLLAGWDKMPRLSDVRWSRSCWVVSDADGVVGAEKILGEFKGILMMTKRDFVVLIILIWGVRRGRVAQINKLALSL